MYALSGIRFAYLVVEPSTAAQLRRWTPPWIVSLPAQLAAVAALRDPEGVANFLSVALPFGGPSAAQLVKECRRHDVYLRDLSPLSPEYEGRTVRVAVRDAVENGRVVAAYKAALAGRQRHGPAELALP